MGKGHILSLVQNAGAKAKYFFPQSQDCSCGSGVKHWTCTGNSVCMHKCGQNGCTCYLLTQHWLKSSFKLRNANKQPCHHVPKHRYTHFSTTALQHQSQRYILLGQEQKWKSYQCWIMPKWATEKQIFIFSYIFYMLCHCSFLETI